MTAKEYKDRYLCLLPRIPACQSMKKYIYDNNPAFWFEKDGNSLFASDNKYIVHLKNEPRTEQELYLLTEEGLKKLLSEICEESMHSEQEYLKIEEEFCKLQAEHPEGLDDEFIFMGRHYIYPPENMFETGQRRQIKDEAPEDVLKLTYSFLCDKSKKSQQNKETKALEEVIER